MQSLSQSQSQGHKDSGRWAWQDMRKLLMAWLPQKLVELHVLIYLFISMQKRTILLKKALIFHLPS